MCVVSMIGDHYSQKWHEWTPIKSVPNTIQPSPGQYIPIGMPEVSRAEFNQLRTEVMEMKELLKKAIKYDEDNNQPNCQMEEKIQFLRKMAEMVGVSLDDVFKSSK